MVINKVLLTAESPHNMDVAVQARKVAPTKEWGEAGNQGLSSISICFMSLDVPFGLADSKGQKAVGADC